MDLGQSVLYSSKYSCTSVELFLMCFLHLSQTLGSFNDAISKWKSKRKKSNRFIPENDNKGFCFRKKKLPEKFLRHFLNNMTNAAWSAFMNIFV